jgi:Domain of unknown function (DUF4430)
MRTLPIALLAFVVAIGCSRSATQSTPDLNGPVSKSVASGTVTVVVEVADQMTQHIVENVTAGTTVEQIMRQLNDLDVEISGSGSTAIVTSMKGLTTSGGKGWTYRIDGEWADRSIGAFELTPPSTIHWKHGNFSEMN